jgi:hypothetical protein
MVNVSLLMGRFQPFTKGHALAVRNIMKDTNDTPIIGIVRGVKSSLDLNRNPFSEDDQRLMIKTALKGITDENIIVIPSAYILEPVLALQEKGMSIKTIYAGGKGDSDDRLSSYKAQLNRAKMPKDVNDPSKVQELIKDVYNLDITYKDTMINNKRLEATSGTGVRQALIDNDYKSFEKGTGYNKDMFSKLRNTILEGKKAMLETKKR